MAGARKFVRRSSFHPEHGYILLTLMFIATLVILSLAALGPQLTQQLKRDREEELVHRGVQYARAIQHFYKRTGRYPVRLEELDNFNNVRFLRKHYKDPITGQDFKILHFGDVRTNFGAGIPGAVAAANMPGGLNPAANGQGGFGNQGFGNQGFGNQGFGNQGFGNQGFGAQPLSQSFGNQGGLGQPGGPNQQGQAANQNSSDQSNSGQGADNNSSNSTQNGNQNGSSSNNQVFGGGPIVGVASTSEKKSIREFNKKNHYKDWQFIYDPSSDRGGLLNTPAQPNLNAQINPGQQNQGQGLAPNQQPSGPGRAPGAPLPTMPPDQTQQPEQQ